jgi:WD40 repeat protein/serine/threonine protein kinase
MNDPESREETLLKAIRRLHGPERAAILNELSAAEAALRQRIEDRLAAEEAATTSGEPADEPQTGPVQDKTQPAVAEGSEGPGSIVGRYKLLQQIGEGGMGVVYMAEQQEPVIRRVALKIIKLGMDTRQVVARFEAERQALALMDHPNIAKVFDGGATSSGRPYFVMELVQGIPITRFCDEAQYDTHQRLQLFMQVCAAIQHAHQKAVIHRDIKPSNVLVTLHGDQPVPKVIDFGIAKSTQQRLTEKTLFTQFQHFIGTPAYMSPEQASLSGLDIDTRSDIYALGVLLYELLTGKTPFDTKALLEAGYEEIRRIIREVEPPKPSTRLSTMRGQELTAAAKQRRADPKKLGLLIRGDLDWIVMKALEKDRTRRYETANGLAADVNRFLKQEPVTAAAPSSAYRIRKFVQRHRTAVLAAATIVILLVAGITISTWLAVVASRAKGEATAARNNVAKANELLKQQIAETERVREAENRQRRRAQESLERMGIQKAEELLNGGQASLGIAYLAQILRANPFNRVASERLGSALIQGHLPFPATEPRSRVISGRFSADGRPLVMVRSEGSVRAWDIQTGEPVTPPLPDDKVFSAQLSPDGQRVLTASFDDTVRVWDARTGQPLTEPLRHDDVVLSAQFSPDGQLVVSTSSDKTARVWDAHTGKPLTDPLRHGELVVYAQFSPDGSRVVTASTDKTARVWDAYTGKPLTDALRHDAPVNSAQFSPDGQRLVTASMDNTARVWDAYTGKSLTTLRHDGAVFWAQFSPDGQRVLTASDKTARVWDAYTGKPLTEAMRHKDVVLSAQFCPNGLRVVTASADKTAAVWDAYTGKPLTEAIRYDAPVRSAQFSPDGLGVISVSSDGTARLWDAQIHKALTQAFHHDAISSAQFSPDGQRVLTASFDNTARVWDARTGQPLTEPLRLGYPVVSARFSPDGQRVLTASDKTARVWDAYTGKPLTEPLRHDYTVWSAQFSPDGRQVVTTSMEGPARVWDALTGKLVIELRHNGRVHSAEFSPDGQRVVTASADKTARVWDAHTGKPLTDPLRHGELVVYAQFSPDGSRVVTASADKTAWVWDAHTGKPLTDALRHDAPVNSAQFSPDGQRLVTASKDSAWVWDAFTGKPLTGALHHNAEVRSALFCQDGQRVLTGSADRTVRVWDALTGQPVSDPFEHEKEVESAEFSSDGQRVLTASMDGTARVWDVAVAPIPVPEWFVEWAESLAGRQFSPQGTDLAVQWAQTRQWRQKIDAQTDTNFFARLARWVQADVATRSISPSSLVTVPQYVQQQIAQNTLLSLGEAVQLSPSNGTAFARLAMLMKDQDPKEHPGRLEEAEFYATYAAKLDPKISETWRTLAEIQSMKTQSIKALQSIERALELQPTGQERQRALLNRARIFRRLNRFDEAGTDNCAAYGIPTRPPTKDQQLVNLSAFYNASFKDNWHGDRVDNDLSELPTGIQDLNGTSFDVRGLVQFGNWKDGVNRFPEEVVGIPLEGKVLRINFLHGAIWGTGPAGTVIGKYVIHYADGSAQERPIVLGTDVLDWFEKPPTGSGELRVAWTGQNAASREQGKTIQLYMTTWENPRPKADIASIDLVSGKQAGAPFLVAITVE